MRSASLLVIDASAFVELLLATGKANAIIHAIGDNEMVAPDFMAVEVLSVLRKLALSGSVGETRIVDAIDDLTDAPVQWLKVAPLLREASDLRNNVSAYDACYVTLAKRLSQPLITSDKRLAGSPDLGIDVLLV